VCIYWQGWDLHQRSILEQSKPANASTYDTVFILRTYADLNGWKLGQIERYVTQLRPINVPVVVIRDVSFLPEGKTDKARARRIRFAVPNGTDPELLRVIGNVHLCDVTWTAVEKEFTRINFSEYSQLGGLDTTIVKKGGVHNPFEILWWRYCRPESLEHVKFMWMAEDDAFFIGHVDRFIKAFASYKTDLIAGGFRIAGKNWWNIKTASSTFPKRMMKFKRRQSGLVDNVPKLPTLKETACNDGTADHVGTIFRQDVVERVSSRLFKMLEEHITNGIVGPGEALLSSICGSKE